MFGTQHSLKWLAPYCLIGALFGLILTVGYSSAAQLRYANTGEVNYGEQFQRVMDTIRAHQVNVEKAKTEEELFNIAVQSMLKATGDEHGHYFTAQEFQRFNEDVRPANYAGVGIAIAPAAGGVIILNIFDNSPLKHMGVRVGDVITAAATLGEPLIRWDGNTEDVQGMIDRMVSAITGPAGTDVTLAIRRGSAEFGTITVTRIQTRNQFVFMKRSVTGVLTIRVTQFSATVYEDIISQLREHGWLGSNGVLDTSTIKGVVLDLRGNPGGLLGQAIKVSDLFLAARTIAVKVVEAPDVMGEPPIAYNYIVPNARVFPAAIPRVVLVDGGSASASEIVAGAVQLHKEAFIMGTKSYGKGSVQTVVPLPGGTAIKTTTAIYFAGGSMAIDGIGVMPNAAVLQPDAIGLSEDDRRFNAHFIRVSLDPDIDHQLNVAHTYIESFISGEHVLDDPESRQAAENKAHGAKTNVNKVCKQKGLRGCPPVDISLLNGYDPSAYGWVVYPDGRRALEPLD